MRKNSFCTIGNAGYYILPIAGILIALVLITYYLIACWARPNKLSLFGDKVFFVKLPSSVNTNAQAHKSLNYKL